MRCHFTWICCEPLDCLAKMCVPQMAVAQRGFNPLMAHEKLYGGQRHSGHHEAARERVPNIVPAEVRDSGGLDRVLEPVTPIAAAGAFVAGADVASSSGKKPSETTRNATLPWGRRAWRGGRECSRRGG